jgi:integral membrane sensor domain MASE1
MGLAQFAPSIIKWITGSDKAEEAAGVVVDIARKVTGQGDGDAALKSIQENPGMALQYRMAVMDNEASLDKAYLANVQSARLRDVEFIKGGRANYRANVLAAGAVLLVVVCLIVVVWQSDMDDFAKATITLICGRALGWVEQVFSFEFGTTRSSQVKDATISNLSK